MKKYTIIIMLSFIFSLSIYTKESKLPEIPKDSGVRGAANFIVATVDQQVILYTDVIRKYKQQIYIYKNTNKKVPEFNFATKKAILKNVMEDIFYIIYAKNAQIEISEAQVNKRLYDIKNQYKIESDEELVVAVNRAGMMGRVENLNQLRDYFRQLMIINKAKSHLVRTKYRSKLQEPTDAQLRNFYNKNPNYFYGPPKVKIQHLVIKVKENADFEEMEKTEKMIKTVIQKAKAGANFSNLVNKYASEAYRSNNGYISNQFLKRSELKSLFPKYAKAAFSLKKGGVSKVIIDGNKRIILKVADKKEKQLLPFDEVKNKIKQYVMSSKGKELLQEWEEKQYRERLIKVHYDRLRVSE